MAAQKEINFVDVTLRDGNQSLWDATGLTTAMMLAIAPVIDKVGFKAVDFVSSIHMGVSVRWQKENPWERIRLIVKAMPNTVLSFGTTGRRFIGFKRMPDSIQGLVLERMAANGIRRVWVLDAAHEMPTIYRTVKQAKTAGIENVIVALSYSISPVHTDEYYAEKARMIAECPDINAIYLKDQGGLLTPERASKLIPVILANIKGLPLEIHSHCSTGLAPLVYLEAIKLGVDTVHTAIPALANGSSLPSVVNTNNNIRRLGYKSGLNLEALQKMADHFADIAKLTGRAPGAPAEYDVYYYEHQVPGGMLSTLKRQLTEISALDKLDTVLEEIIRVRRELGYPIMVTPLSQFVATQATMNVTTGGRYKVIPDGVLQYAAGWFGAPPAPIDKNILDKIAGTPRAKEFFNKELPQPSVKEIRQQMGIGPGVSDEEFLLRYSMTDKEVDEMLAAGPINTKYP